MIKTQLINQLHNTREKLRSIIVSIDNKEKELQTTNKTGTELETMKRALALLYEEEADLEATLEDLEDDLTDYSD
jgi:uncharacterized protein related to proFAR isomerase